MVPGFLQTWRLAFRPNSSILISSDQRILFLMIWESLGVVWQTPSGLSYAFYWGVASVWPLYHKGLSGAEMVVLLDGSPISTEELRSSVRVTVGFLVTSLTKALLPQLLSLARHTALGRVLVVPNFFHLTMMEASVFLVTFNAADIFWYPSPKSVPHPHGLVFAPTCMVNCVTLYRLVCAFPHYVQSIEFTTGRLKLYNQVVETSQEWSMETGCT